MIRGARRVEEAKHLLAALGMPARQQNDNAAYALLAFAGIGPKTPWSLATASRRTPHDVIELAWAQYRKRYAENTRETIRRQAIHQFVQGGILARNPDDASLATNSPRTHYALTDEALSAIRAYGSPLFASEAAAFLEKVGGGLVARYGARRIAAGVEVALPFGKVLLLSPGDHNRLQARVVDEFAPRFAPGAVVLYLGDTAHKSLHVDEAHLAELGVPMTKHDKLPDVVLYDDARRWLFLVEAVTSHGPVSPKRHAELEDALRGCNAGRIYVSAFLTFREFKRHASEIAWETEVWIADAPGHLLHYNGDRFFGPR
jgi:hypothetical protein